LHAHLKPITVLAAQSITAPSATIAFQRWSRVLERTLRRRSHKNEGTCDRRQNTFFKELYKSWNPLRCLRFLSHVDTEKSERDPYPARSSANW
jgi:hypothetical protein